MTFNAYLNTDYLSADADLRSYLINMIADILQVSLALDGGDVLRSDVPEWDSFNHLRLVLELEQTFDITLDTEEVVELNSLNDILNCLAQREITDLQV